MQDQNLGFQSTRARVYSRCDSQNRNGQNPKEGIGRE